LLTWDDFNLKDDPFGVAPPKDEIIWADRETFRTELKNAIRRSLLSTPSRIVACIWGDWGTGKTHAMTYFSRADVLKQLITEMNLKATLLPISIQIIFPMGNILDTIYLEIIEQIGVGRIIKALEKLEETDTIRPKEVLVRDVSKYMDVRVAEAFVTLKGQKPFIFQRYLSMTATSAELRKLGIARGISTSTDKIRTISGILKLLTGTMASRVFIWFDDLERIGDSPGKDIFEFQHFIRDLLDNVPKKLVLFFNMTMLPGEKVEDRLAYLGDAISYRISDKITVGSLTKEEFFVYVSDLLRSFRIRPSNGESDFFPFEKSALDSIFSELKRNQIPLVPRNVNDTLSSALSRAVNDVEKRDPTITKLFLEQNYNEIFKGLFQRARKT